MNTVKGGRLIIYGKRYEPKSAYSGRNIPTVSYQILEIENKYGKQRILLDEVSIGFDGCDEAKCTFTIENISYTSLDGYIVFSFNDDRGMEIDKNNPSIIYKNISNISIDFCSLEYRSINDMQCRWDSHLGDDSFDEILEQYAKWRDFYAPRDIRDMLKV